MQYKNLQEAMKNWGLDEPLGAIGYAFDCMDQAEAAIKAAQRKHRKNKDLLWRSFRMLMPTDAMRHKSPKLYRLHCDELLQRAILGGDVTQATDAELIAALCDTSLVAPIGHASIYLYMRLFRKHRDALTTANMGAIFEQGDNLAKFEGDWLIDAANITESDMRSRMVQYWRREYDPHTYRVDKEPAQVSP